MKFRVWDEFNGRFPINDGSVFMDGAGKMWEEAWDKNDTSSLEIVKARRFHPEMYTGLHDKNGVEIYEGDILGHESHSITRVVEWRQDECRFSIWGNGCPYYLSQSWAQKYKVVGNIHENPELLEV